MGLIQKLFAKKIKKFFFKRRNLFTFGEYSIVRTKNNYLKGEMFMLTLIEQLKKDGSITFEKFRMMDNFLEECEYNDIEVNVTKDEDNFYIVTLIK